MSDEHEIPEPAAKKKSSGGPLRWFGGLKRETRFGAAAVMSFAILVGALLVKKSRDNETTPTEIAGSKGSDSKAANKASTTLSLPAATGAADTQIEVTPATEVVHNAGEDPSGEAPATPPSPSGSPYQTADPSVRVTEQTEALPPTPVGDQPPPATTVTAGEVPPQPTAVDNASASFGAVAAGDTELPPPSTELAPPSPTLAQEPATETPVESTGDIPLPTATVASEPAKDAAPPLGTTKPEENLPPLGAPVVAETKPELPADNATPPAGPATKLNAAPALAGDPPGIPANELSTPKPDPIPVAQSPKVVPIPVPTTPKTARGLPPLNPTPETSVQTVSATESKNVGVGLIPVLEESGFVESTPPSNTVRAATSRGSKFDKFDDEAAGSFSAVAVSKATVKEDPPTEVTLHKVERGENFWTISKFYYNSGRYYKALYAANRDKATAIDKLYVGTTIRVPPPEQLNPALIEAAPAATVAPASKKLTKTATRNEIERVPSNEDDFDQAPSGSSRAKEAPATLRDPDQPSVRSNNLPIYKVKSYDTFRSIARDTLGSARRVNEIMDLNRDVIDDSDRPTPGQILRLPPDARVSTRRARP